MKTNDIKNVCKGNIQSLYPWGSKKIDLTIFQSKVIAKEIVQEGKLSIKASCSRLSISKNIYRYKPKYSVENQRIGEC